MPTTDEIQRRVEEADAARGAKRSSTAMRVGELAMRRATVAEQLAAIERELGDVIAESRDVIEIDELARFTDLPAADLTRWLNDRKATRPKRKRATTATSTTKSNVSYGATTTEAPSTSRSSIDAQHASAPVSAEVA